MQDEIIERISARIPNAEIDVALDGNKVVIEVTSNHFAGMGRVAKQQAVYSCIEDYIADGRLHAVTIKAEVPA
jgi:acid stress-induced BolA-like protein IbaG/YrbA